MGPGPSARGAPSAGGFRFHTPEEIFREFFGGRDPFADFFGDSFGFSGAFGSSQGSRSGGMGNMMDPFGGFGFGSPFGMMGNMGMGGTGQGIPTILEQHQRLHQMHQQVHSQSQFHNQLHQNNLLPQQQQQQQQQSSSSIDPFGGANRSFASSSTLFQSQSSSSGNRPAMISQSTSTRIVNGHRTTVTKSIDAQGNTRVETVVVSPNGTTSRKVEVNGVMQLENGSNGSSGSGQRFLK